MDDGHSLRQRDQGRGDDDSHRLDGAGDGGRLQLRVQIMKMRAVWIAALILLAAMLASAGKMLLGVGKAPGSGHSYTPPCSVGPRCVCAYSTERQTVSTATTALQALG
jgi:hypothetical protein